MLVSLKRVTGSHYIFAHPETNKEYQCHTIGMMWQKGPCWRFLMNLAKGREDLEDLL